MKNYKVKAIRFFRDSNEIDEKTGRKIERKINDEFYCTKERYEFLKQNNAVKLVEELKEENQEDYDNVDFKIVQDWEKEQERKEEMKQKPNKKRTSKK